MEYLKNSLFTKFCHWFLDESNRLFPFPNRSVACEVLSSYIAEQVDDIEVDFEKLVIAFPALRFALDQESSVAIQILENVLAKCERIQHLRIYSLTSHFLRSLRPSVCEGLKSLTLRGTNTHAPKTDGIILIPENSPLPFISVWHDRSTKLTVHHMKVPVAELDTMLGFSDRWNKSVHLVLNVDNPNIRLFSNHPSVHSLELHNSDHRSDAFFPSMFQRFPQIGSLFLSNFRMDADVTSTFSAAVERLTNLSTLDISNNSAVGRNLEKFFV